MDIPLPVTLLFIGLFTALYVPMGIAVGLRRAKTGIMFLDGGDETLLRRMRAHGNFAEYVPLAILALGAAELAGLPNAALLGAGAALLVGRLVHYAALVRIVPDAGRLVGAGLTSATMFLLAMGVLLRIWGAA